MPSGQFVSRAGDKLQFALNSFNISSKNLIVSDFGSSTGGFVDCLLKNNVKKIYSVDVSYGELAWKLRNDPKVIVMERTNALHVTLPEKVDLITIDTGWTKQKLILPNALANLRENGLIISLIKPHYEADKKYLRKGKLMEDHVDEVIERVKKEIQDLGIEIKGFVESPIVGEKGKNREFLALLKLFY